MVSEVPSPTSFTVPLSSSSNAETLMVVVLLIEVNLAEPPLMV